MHFMEGWDTLWEGKGIYLRTSACMYSMRE